MNLENKVLALYDVNRRLIFKGRTLDPVPFFEGMRILALETAAGEVVLVDFPSGGLIKVYADWEDAKRAETSMLRDDLEARIRELILETGYQKIQVIKQARSLSGLGLKEAKELVEAIAEKMKTEGISF